MVWWDVCAAHDHSAAHDETVYAMFISDYPNGEPAGRLVKSGIFVHFRFCRGQLVTSAQRVLDPWGGGRAARSRSRVYTGDSIISRHPWKRRKNSDSTSIKIAAGMGRLDSEISHGEPDGHCWNTRQAA